MLLKGMQFADTDITLDGIEYEDCDFLRCRLHYSGFAPVRLTSNRFNQCDWSFDGPAGNAVSFMSLLYKQGGEAQQLIENTLNIIRGGGGPHQTSSLVN